VIAGGVAEPERVPDTRWRHALFASLRGYLCPTRSTLIAGYRFYTDDWGVSAHTPELRLVQGLGGGAELRLRYRYYRQTRADFFKDIYDSADPAVEPFLTDDPKLSAFETQTFGALLAAPLSLLGAGGSLAAVRVEGLVEHVAQTSRFGDAFIAQVAITVPLEY
jgi:hypothetical protein